MYRSRYVSSLATVLRGSAVPYGYTVTVWTSGMMLTRERGIPTAGQVFLFMLGAVGAFATLGTIVRLAGATPFEPPPGALRRTGMTHVVAIGVALGSATLVSLIHSGVVWPLGSFVATAMYLAMTTLELAVAGRK